MRKLYSVFNEGTMRGALCLNVFTIGFIPNLEGFCTKLDIS
nr:MAG TPA: hypothetical protein [Bacteriophage sp.]